MKFFKNKLYFSVNSIPELSELSSEKKWQLWRQCILENFNHREFWIAFLGYILWLFLSYLTIEWLWLKYHYNSFLLTLAHGLIGYGIGMIFFWAALIKIFKPYLLQKLDKENQDQ